MSKDRKKVSQLWGKREFAFPLPSSSVWAPSSLDGTQQRSPVFSQPTHKPVSWTHPEIKLYQLPRHLLVQINWHLMLTIMALLLCLVDKLIRACYSFSYWALNLKMIILRLPFSGRETIIGTISFLLCSVILSLEMQCYIDQKFSYVFYRSPRIPKILSEGS